MLNSSLIAKIGGKILENPEDLDFTISQFKLLLKKKIIQQIIIIPGGGKFSNFIREIDDKLDIGDDLAHWMAIYAINQSGKMLNKEYPNIEITDNFKELQKFKNPLSIFLPFNYLYQTDELPHSWDVTSDSISLYLAHKLELNECYLIKDVDGIINDKNQVIKELSIMEYKNLKKLDMLANIRTNHEDLKRSKPTDQYSLTLIDKYKITCIILNGTNKKSRILSYFERSKNSDNIYTRINFENKKKRLKF